MLGRLFAFLRTWGIGLLLVAAGVWVAWHFVAPPPPAVVRIASGPEGSVYQQVADFYAQALRREGLVVEVRPTEGSLENLALLRSRDADLAPVQGGVTLQERDQGLVSLGGVFNEPAWVFYRRGAGLRSPMQVQGRRVAVGPEGSGTRALAIALLAANEVTESSFTPLPLAGLAAAEALLAGEVDVAFFVSARPGPAISLLLRNADKAELANFATRAPAYAVRLPFLSPVVLPRGGFSLAEDLPRESITLMAAGAFVAAREELSPALAALMVRTMQHAHRARQLFAPEGSYPTPLNQELPLHPAARHAHERGPSFFQQYLPFQWAVLVERLWVLAIPLVTLLLPLLRFAPPIYAWQMRMRIWRWYDRLRRVERDALAAGDNPTARAAAARRLEELEAQVSQIGVSAGYAALLYALRGDIDYVRRRLGGS
jgi:TRAP transporter TAXI family solute receptor